MTDSIIRLIVDIIATKYIGRLRHTYFRAKAFELLCEVIDGLTHEAQNGDSELPLSWRDKRLLDQAREIIRKDCMNCRRSIRSGGSSD